MKKKVYRTLSLVFAFALAFGMVSFAADGEALTMTAASVSLEQGEGTATVEIPITFEGNVKLTALEAVVKFDDALTCVEYIAGDSLSGIVDPAVGTNSVSFVFLDTTLNGVETKTGTFATLKVQVPVEASRDYAIDVSVSAVADEQFNDITSTLTAVDGKISVTASETSKEDETTVDKEEIPDDVMTSQKRAEDIICLKIDTSYAYAFGELISIDDTNDKVVPYIVNDRTLVPLRFVSETLGADVLWEDGWDYCYVNKGDKKIKITFGSADIEVNGEVITYDAPVQVVENRTMVPIRFISEELGYHVHWNQPNKAVVISPADNPWVKDRDAEKSLLTDILVMFLMKGMA
ncbi:MAG: hypothetical protein IJN62_00900 [Clostridia bacterium]|nr:hypothetical protein [Clostridia bacterium]